MAQFLGLEWWGDRGGSAPGYPKTINFLFLRKKKPVRCPPTTCFLGRRGTGWGAARAVPCAMADPQGEDP